MIELRQVTIHVGQFSLSDLNLRIETGEYAVLMGKTGRGKTTILEAICGLRQIQSGSIWLRATNITKWSPRDRQIGYVPQDVALFPNLQVREQLEFALKLRNWSRAKRDARVGELANVLGIEHLLSRPIQGLSGGEAQRVALGRALAIRPAVLLLDEPLSALDQSIREEMHTWLKKVKSSTGVTTLHVTHNAEEATALADRRLHLDESGAITG